ncbi:MAG TPA: helicase, partial [Actinoplanes sp.]
MTTRPAWTPDPGLVRQVEEQFEGAINSYQALPTLIPEHAGLEESIRTGGYANRTLHELVQNAADAMSGDSTAHQGAAGRVEIVLDIENHNLYCANTGRPFSASGFTSIMHAYVSAKRGDEIGRFGLGFKSVLAVSTAPQVFSRSISFEFNSLAARNRLAAIGFAAKRYPVLRTATVIDPDTAFAADSVLAELAEWATTIVKLPLVTGLDRLRREIEDFASEFLLFVGAVREVRLRIIDPEEFETSHRSRDFGDGIFKIERPDGSGDEWIVENRMHESSAEARAEVGEAVSRKRVKVTVAVPKRHARLRIGKFWSYFPLVDNTSASALFNAPWSVNDDRTTLLENAYNREILGTVAGMFVELLPRLSGDDDPAVHLDYMPARGDESLSFGDKLLCAHVPRFAAIRQLVPNASGTLTAATELRPLDFAVEVNSEVHRAWISSP